jgi:transcriptional regulator with XRE-family HTH domain
MITKLPENIRQLRKEKNLTQAQLAEAMGVSIGAVSKWELGQSMPEITMLMTLADFFTVSVDTILGYEVASDDLASICKRIKAYQLQKNYQKGQIEVEMALKKYPNSFEIVYQSAELYSLFGLETHNQAFLERAISLLQKSCSLIHQNTNNKISELSIQINIAEIYVSMGNEAKALEKLKTHNPCGINDNMIGLVLSTISKTPEEAFPYLSRAFLKNITTFIRISVGYVNAFFKTKEYASAIDMLNFVLSIFPSLKYPDKTSSLEKTEAVLFAALAQMYYFTNDFDEAKKHLITAKKIAKHFDRNPDHSANSIRYIYNDEPMTIYDDMGATAIDGIEQTLLDSDIPQGLRILWKEVLENEN